MYVRLMQKWGEHASGAVLQPLEPLARHMLEVGLAQHATKAEYDAYATKAAKAAEIETATAEPEANEMQDKPRKRRRTRKTVQPPAEE